MRKAMEESESCKKYVGIAKMVAALLNKSYVDNLFVYPEVDRRKLEHAKQRVELAQEEEIKRLESSLRMLAAAKAPSETMEARMLALQQTVESVVHALMARATKTGADVGIGPASAYSVPLDEHAEPSQVLIGNVNAAAAEISRFLDARITWEELWVLGDETVRPTFAELVAIWVETGYSRMKEVRNEKVKTETAFQRKARLLANFRDLRCGEDGYYHFGEGRRFRDKCNPDVGAPY